MNLAIMIFFSIMVLIWWGAHYYVVRSICVGLSEKIRRVMYISFGIHSILGPVAMVMRRVPEVEPLLTVWNWVAYIGMGAFTFLFVVTLLKDMGWLAFLGVEKVITDEGERLIDEDRRRFMTIGLNAGVLSTTGIATKWGFYQARRLPDVVDVTVPLEDLSDGLDGFRIVQLSDIHVGPTIGRSTVEGIVERVNELDADVVVITGDLIDGLVDSLWEDVKPLLNLQARHGIYFCTGNHEYYWDALDWCRVLEEHGVRVLNNEHELIEHDSGRLLMAGCTDYTAGDYVEEHASDPKGALAGAPDYDASILLAHQPPSIHEAAEAGYDLQLSGHTHGGQFWPWIYVVGMVHPFATGLNRQDDTWIYVSRGTGYWGPPMRVGAPSEITLLTLTRGGEEDADKVRVGGDEVP